MTPIELAAWMHDVEAVDVLLPCTKKVLEYQVWTTCEILNYTRTKEASRMV